MSGALMDQAIAKVGAKQWHLSILDTAACGQSDCADPIPFGTFASEACRPLSKHVKSIQVLFDLHLGIPSCGDAAELGQLVASGRYEDLPQPLAFQASVPRTSKVDFLRISLGRNQVSILKVLYLPRPVSFQVANSLCSGEAFVPVFRPGPWNIKKAVQFLLSKLGGYQVRWHVLQEKKRLRLPAVRPNGAHPIKNLKKGLASSMLTPQNATPETNKLCGSL